MQSPLLPSVQSFCTPPLLQSGGSKAYRAPAGATEAQLTNQPQALPVEGCLTSTCSGSPFFQAEQQLTGPWFFPALWGDTQELPEALNNEGRGRPDSPPWSFPWPGPDPLQEATRPEFCFPPVPHALVEFATGGPMQPPNTPSPADRSDAPQPQGRPVSGRGDHKPSFGAVRRGGSRPEGV